MSSTNPTHHTEDTRLFKVYTDSATRELQVGDVVVWCDVPKHSTLTKNKPYVVIKVTPKSLGVYVVTDLGCEQLCGRGAGFKVVVTTPISYSKISDVCIKRNNSLYSIDTVGHWLFVDITDKVLILSDAVNKKRGFKNSKITIIKDTPDGYDFV